MLGRDNGGALFAGGKRQRSWFRRIFYREHPFDVLDAAELTAIHEAFCAAVRLHPGVLHWVHRLDDQEYLVSSFQHWSMRGYSGLEVVHVTPEDLGYYRLPGAQRGGRGQVAPGMYSVSIQSPGRKQYYLRIRKCKFGQLHVDEIGVHPVQDAASFLSLKWCALNRSKFADEMRITVERSIEWDYQRALLGERHMISDADRAELARKCTGMSRRVDAFLHELSERALPRGGNP